MRKSEREKRERATTMTTIDVSFSNNACPLLPFLSFDAPWALSATARISSRRRLSAAACWRCEASFEGMEEGGEGRTETRKEERKEKVSRDFLFLFFVSFVFTTVLSLPPLYYSCSSTGAAQTGHVASLIPRLPTHRSSHSKAHERWNSWPQPSRKEGLSAQKRSRQVGQVSSSSSLSSSSVEGGSFEFLASLRLGLLEERRWGAGIALVVAAVVEVPAAAAATAAAELSAFESSGVPSSDDDEELLFRRCCL